MGNFNIKKLNFMGRNFVKIVMFSLSIVVVVNLKAQSEGELKILKQFNCKEKVIYKIVNGDTLDMTIFLPKNKPTSKMPIMIFTHGGGWSQGDKYVIFKDPFFRTLKILTDNGIACASIEYRLTRKKVSTVYDCVVDCKDAARFLVKNAEEYSIDVNKMGVWGGSAGGHLSLMTALGKNSDFIGDKTLSKYEPSFVCVSSYFPLTSFIRSEFLAGSSFEKPSRFVIMFGGLLSDNEKIAKAVSPAEILTKNAPAILLLHGDKDIILPIAQSKYMMDVAKKVGADVNLYIVKNSGHSFVGKNIEPSMDEINDYSANFIMKHLLKKNKLK
jgi:acetyl esterase/lipase